MSGVKFWCLVCKDRCLTWKCTKHGSEPVFHYSYKLRVPDFKNKARFRQFVEKVNIFFNCVTEDQKPLLKIVAKDLRIEGKTINGRIF